MIRIITDSASDILPAEADLLGVQVIPLNVTFEDGTVVRDGLDLAPQEYYELLPQCGKLPTTSQPSPELFEAAYREALAAGDTVVGLFLSSQLSGTFQSARMAVEMAEATEAQIRLVDTETVCLAEALLVRMAVRLRDAGKSADEIVAAVERAKRHLHLVAVVDDLKYLRKGGRLPAAVAIAGGMLGIKPLITVKEGKVAMAGKARGLPGAYVALFKQIDALGGIAPGSEVVAAYTASVREVEPIESYFTNNLHRAAPFARRIGCVIGTHTGPGAFGFAFFDAALDPELLAAVADASKGGAQ
jgi:DegV family protein with EDD domain